ncbi:MAG: putative nuclease of putative toxin-antitoxin system [Bacteroidia bacterium]|jgi:predicted nuclease of predicted toxin-antitoxin system
MKLLLDENLPVRLKFRIRPHFEVSSISDEKWNSIKNGELLSRMNRTGFTHLITSDKNLQHQQNLEKFNVVVIILDSVNNRYELLNDFIEPIEKFLNSDFQGRVHTITL